MPTDSSSARVVSSYKGKGDQYECMYALVLGIYVY